MTDLLPRLGVDIGGTFTDVVLETHQGLHSTKVLTTYAAPDDAILDGIRQVCEKAGIRPDSVQQIIHGTTLATNALIERRGVRTAFITTEGFRDVIEMRNESRFEQYDLNLTLPEPLLARQHRYTIRERVSASGESLIAIDTDAVERLTRRLAKAGYQSIAVGFLHSYLYPSHEQRVREILQRECPDVMVSLSCEVSPQMREYERFNTTIANAYIKPLIKQYLERLLVRLRHNRINCPVFLMHSGGGIMSVSDAAEFPVRLVESGPAGGAVFAADIAARHALDKVLSFDMGGTTAKICLIRNCKPSTSRVFEVARSYRFKKGSGMPVSIPVIDMVEIGAGGGSLAHLDSLKQIRVGPESASSEPGPACYGRGGEGAAVTDADLVLGKLDPDNFAGGSIELKVDRAEAALRHSIGQTLNMDARTAALGIAEVVDENMANAARVHAVENGEDVSSYTMIAFGGAAPLHAGRLCEKLRITRLLIPPGAGVGSAIGFLRAPFSFEASRSVYMRLSEFDATMAAQLLGELEEEATGFVRSCDAQAELTASCKVFMRYTGQGWEIPVELSMHHPSALKEQNIQQQFESEYEALFGRTVSGLDIEITVWSVNAATVRNSVDVLIPSEKGSEAEAAGMRHLFDSHSGEFVETPVIERESLQTGQTVTGPAVIVEAETTVVIPGAYRALRESDGSLDIQLIR